MISVLAAGQVYETESFTRSRNTRFCLLFDVQNLHQEKTHAEQPFPTRNTFPPSTPRLPPILLVLQRVATRSVLCTLKILNPSIQCNQIGHIQVALWMGIDEIYMAIILSCFVCVVR